MTPCPSAPVPSDARRWARHRSALVAAALLLAACQPKAEKPPPEIRPVRTVTVEKREAGVPVVLTGRIQAQNEVSLAFRISGRMVERTVNLGDRSSPTRSWPASSRRTR